MKRSKKYKEAIKLVDKTKLYEIEEAVELIPKISTCKFDASVELHVKLNIPSKYEKEVIRGSVIFPYKTGPEVKIVVLTTSEYFDKAKEADFYGAEDLIKKIENGWNEFDVVIATPNIMTKLAPLGKILGPKGLMPNPKNNTVTTNLEEIIKSYKKGKTDFKTDNNKNIHIVVGKVSTKKEHLIENIKIALKSIIDSSKRYNPNPIKTAYLSPTIGPSIKLNVR